MSFLFFVFVFSINAQTENPAASPQLQQVLNRLGNEAEAFRKTAPTVSAEETLDQLYREPGQSEHTENHEVVSEYGYASLQASPNALHEVRKVISVDGHRVTSVAKARETLTLDVHSGDDKLKKRLLEQFEKYGLRGAATDFGQIILLFSPRHLKEYQFQLTGERQVGAESLLAFSFEQITGSGSFTVFQGNTAQRNPLKGEILARKEDGLPLRISLTTIHKINHITVTDQSTVDYAETKLGSILPVSVVHREYVDKEMLTENSFFYSPFRKWAKGKKLSLSDQ